MIRSLPLFIIMIALFNFITAFSPAYAQTSNLSGLQILQSFTGGNQTGATNALSSSAGIPASASSNILGNLTQNATPAVGGNVLDQLMKGNITSAMAQTLSASTQLSQVSSFADVTKLLQNPTIQQQLQGLLPGDIGKALTGLSAIAGGQPAVNALATPAGAAALTNSLPAALKQILSALLGGPTGIASAILGAATQQATAAAAPPPAGGSSSGGSCPSSEKYQLYKPDCKPNPVQQSCTFGCAAGCCKCEQPIQKNHKDIRAHMTAEFVKHRNWMIDEFFTKHVLPAMKMMTSQLSTIAIQQVQMIGTFFDAKHQLETQRLFQQLMAEAHKDYQPSEGMCEVGTSVRSLAASSRKTDLGHVAFANRVMDRTLRRGDTASAGEENSDLYSRIDMFVKNHCNKADNSNGLNYLCAKGGNTKARMNKDVDFTRTIESELTLDIDFTQGDAAQQQPQPDAEDVFALESNLFAHEPLPFVTRLILATPQGQPRAAAHRYMDLRSIAAKRSVAENSFTAMTAERAKGDKEVAPYLKKLVTELGVPDDKVEEILGKEPSYFAQMEVLTKDIYQNPVFYTELYDKPANILRKTAAIRALSLMQERDLYESQLRNEAVLAVMLETMLHEEHNRVSGQLDDLEPEGADR